MSVSDANDDLDVDEHGILREKEATLEDQGIILDDDGILRDEADRYSHFTYCTDSGLGTVDRKSSSSTLHRLPGSLNNLTDTHLVTPDNDEILSGKRISDYEVSESIHGEVSYDQVSVGSGYGDLPYYEESYTTGRTSTADQSRYSRNDYSYDSYDNYQDGAEDYEASSISFMNSGELEPKEIQPADDKYRDLYHGSKSQDASLQNTGYNSAYDSSLGYLLGSYKKIEPNDDVEDDNIDEEYGINSRYKDSLFSQEEQVEPKRSLREFEVIEAQLKAADVLGDEHDLIGAYLSSVEQQERDEDSDDENNKYQDDIVSVSQQFNRDDLNREKPDFVPNLQFSDSIVGSQDNDETVDTDLQSTKNSTQLSRGYRAPTPTRIPMWRDRSPSMSRPGSSLSRQGSVSPSRNRRLLSEDTRDSGLSMTDRGRSLTRPSKTRALPIAPNTPSPKPVARPPSPSQRRTAMSPANNLDQAAALLVDDGEVSGSSEGRSGSGKEDEKMRSFRIRRSPSPTKREPMKAFAENPKTRSQDSGEETTRSETSKKALTKKLEEEKGQRERENEDYKMLMSEHNRIQEKLALAENTIDELRTGAKITLYADSPTPQQGQAGTLAAPQQSQSFSIGKVSSAVMGHTGLAAQSQRATVSNQPGSRPGSRTSQPSDRPTSTELKSAVQSPDLDQPEDMSVALKEESSKMALLLQAKDLDEKLEAFQTLLEGDHLTAEEQRQALINIKKCHDDLQKEYQNVKSEHDQARKHAGSQGVFDSTNEVNGELYKLSMKLDGLENSVEKSMQEKSNQRQPFRGPTPVKGHHQVSEPTNDVEGSNGVTDKRNGKRRPASVSSVAGGASDVDEQLHQLQKDYDNCIHQYRRVKQMPHSAERVHQVDSLLKQIKKIYEETPDHRKPPLPPELEKMYDGKQGGFVPPEQMNRRSDSERPARLTKEQIESPRRTNPSARLRKERKPSEVSSTSRYSESDISTPSTRDSRVRRPRMVADDSRASEYVSSTSGNSAPQTSRRRRGLPSRPSRQSGVSESQQGAAATGHRQPRGSSRRAELVDKDSGYVGSTSSKRLPGQLPRQGGRPGTASRHQPVKTSALDDDRAVYHGPTSDSDASTVEYRTPRRPVTTSSSKHPGKETARQMRRHSYSSGSDSVSRTRNKTPRSHALDSEEVYSSDASRSTVRSSNAKLKNLEDELTRLKERMESPGTVQYPQQTPGVPLATAPTGTMQYLPQHNNVPVPSNGAMYYQTNGQYTGQDTGVPVAAAGYYQGSRVPGQYAGQPAGWGYGAFVSGPGEYRPRSNSSPPERRSSSPRRSRTRSPYRYREESPGRRSYTQPYREDYDDEIDGQYREASRWDRGREYHRYSPKDREYSRNSPKDKYYDDYLTDDDNYNERRYRSMHDYYLPTNSGSNPRPSSRGPGYDYNDYDNTYPKQYASYPETQPATSGVQGHYVETSSNVCPMCGGVGYHTHEGYSHPPQPQQPNPQAVYVTQTAPQPVPVQTPVQHPAPLQPTNTANGRVMLPVQVVPMKRSSSTPNVSHAGRGKVRYYVREYGGESSDDRHSAVKIVKRPSRRTVHQDVVSDGEIEGDNLDDSLENAAKTAKALKYLSGKMKNSLLEELNVTYRHTTAMAKLI